MNSERDSIRPQHRPAGPFTIARFGDLAFVHTEHVNWVVYAGTDGVTLIDSGYIGQRDELVSSLQELGYRPEEITAVLVTHAHADHLGGAAWLSAEYGTPVYTGDIELPHLHRERLEQVTTAQVLRNALRPGVVGWAAGILPLLGGDPALGIPAAQPLPVEGDRIDVPGRPRPLLLPGHTSGHVAYHFPDQRILATGDALITGHRTSRRRGPQMLAPMFHRDLPEAYESLEHVAGVEADLILPGHGPVWAGPTADAVRHARRG